MNLLQKPRPMLVKHLGDLMPDAWCPSNIRVYCRVRPLLPGQEVQNAVPPGGRPQNLDQRLLFEKVARQLRLERLLLLRVGDHVQQLARPRERLEVVERVTCTKRPP